MEADYVIVGAGSAGCVLANRLTEDPNVRVVLIEAGGRDWNPLIHIPVGFMKLLDHKTLTWGFNLRSVPKLSACRARSAKCGWVAAPSLADAFERALQRRVDYLRGLVFVRHRAGNQHRAGHHAQQAPGPLLSGAGRPFHQ